MKGMETERRDDAIAKRNRKQESQAIKAMKRCGHAAQSAGAGIGAVVTLKVDFRTHSHTQGPITIVYEMKESTGGILVCCEHGVITHDGSRKDYWIPYDKYTINARTQDSPVAVNKAVVSDGNALCSPTFGWVRQCDGL